MRRKKRKQTKTEGRGKDKKEEREKAAGEERSEIVEGDEKDVFCRTGQRAKKATHDFVQRMEKKGGNKTQTPLPVFDWKGKKKKGVKRVRSEVPVGVEKAKGGFMGRRGGGRESSPPSTKKKRGGGWWGSEKEGHLWQLMAGKGRQNKTQSFSFPKKEGRGTCKARFRPGEEEEKRHVEENSKRGKKEKREDPLMKNLSGKKEGKDKVWSRRSGGGGANDTTLQAEGGKRRERPVFSGGKTHTKAVSALKRKDVPQDGKEGERHKHCYPAAAWGKEGGTRTATLPLSIYSKGERGWKAAKWETGKRKVKREGGMSPVLWKRKKKGVFSLGIAVWARKKRKRAGSPKKRTGTRNRVNFLIPRAWGKGEKG